MSRKRFNSSLLALLCAYFCHIQDTFISIHKMYFLLTSMSSLFHSIHICLSLFLYFPLYEYLHFHSIPFLISLLHFFLLIIFFSLFLSSSLILSLSLYLSIYFYMQRIWQSNLYVGLCNLSKMNEKYQIMLSEAIVDRRSYWPKKW